MGQDDRWDAIVGYDGYVAMDGDKLSICLFYGSNKGVNRAIPRIEAMDGHVDQVGDYEVGGTIPVDQIEQALKLIRVSRLHVGTASNLDPRTEHAQPPESTQTPAPVPQHPENQNSGVNPPCAGPEVAK